MVRRIIAVIFVFIVQQCWLSSSAFAQSGGSCVRQQECQTLNVPNGQGFACQPYQPKTAWGCFSDLVGDEWCWVNTNTCFSGDAPRETACAACQSAIAN